MKTITFFIYNNYTALDIAGPYEVLSKLPDYQIQFAALEKGIYTDSKEFKIVVDDIISEVHKTDILIIPGGSGIFNLLSNRLIIDWIKDINETTEWTAAVCTGAFLLAEAGLLKNKHCTTHWRSRAKLAEYGVKVCRQRYVADGKILTSAGVSAGIDMALFLTSKLTNDTVAQIVQLGIEYDPEPPFACGSLEKADENIIEMLTQKQH